MKRLLVCIEVLCMRLACLVLAFVLIATSACGSQTAAPADPPGPLVRLQRSSEADSFPGDLTIFNNGALQLYIGDRGALRKQVPLADLADLQEALGDPALSTVAETYPATLPASAGDTLIIFGAQRRSIRYDPRSFDLPPPLQRLVGEVMKLRRRF